MGRLRLALVLALALAPEARAFVDLNGEMIRFQYEEPYEPLFHLEDGVYRARQSPNSLRCSFPAAKRAGTFRVFVLGESVGLRFFMGSSCPTDHYPSERGMELAWRKLLPGSEVETISASVASYDSARLLLRLQELLDYKPDLVIVLTGNNEPEDPAQDPSQFKRFAAGYLWRSRAVREFQSHLADSRLRPKRTPDQIRERYRTNIAAMAGEAARRGVPVVFCALPRSLVYPPGFVMPLWKEAFFKGWSALERGDGAEAERLFAEFELSDPGAWGPYGRGLALIRRGLFAQAFAALSDATELDATSIRPSMNRDLKEEARLGGAAVADFQTEIAAASPDGIPDATMFEDDVHWEPALNLLLDAAVQRAFLERRADWPSAAGLRVDAAYPAVARRKGLAALKARDRLAMARITLLTAVGAMTSFQQRLDEKSIFSFGVVERLSPGFTKRLLRPAPDAETMTEFAGNWWTKDRLEDVRRRWPEVLDALGESHRRAGRLADAAAAFKLALELSPDRPLTHLRLALAEAAAGRREEARKQYEAAAVHGDEFPEIRYYGPQL